MSETLIELVTRYTDTQIGETLATDVQTFATPVPGLRIVRGEREQKHPSALIVTPRLCVVLQGTKWNTFGGKRFDHGPGRAFVIGVELPALSRVVKASPTEPYLGLVVEFDPVVMRDVMYALDVPPTPAGQVGNGVCVTNFNGPLFDCALRLVRLLYTPAGIPVLTPLIMREIYYWLLTGPHGAEIARFALGTNYTHGIVKAIHVLQKKFIKSVKIEDLAAIAQMSPSAFHRKFKAITTMTPIQYQKRLRLLEARHLILSGAANVENAAFRVGYESPSQFSREYARMFGAPPLRDMAARQTPAA